MNRRTAMLAALATALAASSRVANGASGQQKVWYVGGARAAGGDGTGWNAAFASLQDALAAAASGDEIWVARGTYHPHATDATQSFVLKQDVALYGGFSGNETARDQRDVTRNTTILSGNIGNGDKTSNTHTIVMGADRAVLDGFTIADAYGTDVPRMHLVPADILKGDMVVGGGMRNFMTSPVVRNCVFRNNQSPKGGAVYNVHKPGADQASFTNVAFTDNVAELRGGAVSNDLGAMPRFVDCRFTGNRCMDKGGGMYNDFAASPMVFNALFTGNEAVSAGGIGNDGGSAPLLVNVTIAGNTASSGLGAGLYQGTGVNSNPILVNSAVDNVYNWHEDIVAQVGSTVPGDQTVPLATFLPLSNLNGALQASDLAAPPAYGVGYRADLNGDLLLQNALVAKLVQLYVANGGAVEYRAAYERQAVTRQAVSASVIHVVPTSTTTTPDGLSWATALTDLQDAIELASVSKAAVWIAAGTYRPATQAGRIAAFILYDGVSLCGGFAGTETALDQRPASRAETILSAKTATGDGRCPHVLYGANNAVLDRLTVRDGDATGFTYNGKGGGLLAYHAGKTFRPHDDAVGFAMTIRDCRFEANGALEGGAIYAFGKAALSVSNTIFKDNRAHYGGAVVDREGVTSAFQQCSFIGNAATQDGGATYEDYGSHANFSDVTFEGNKAAHEGGAIYVISRASQLEATAVTVTHCTFSGNEAAEGASIYNLDDSTLTIEGSTYPANSVHNPAPAAK